MTGIILSKGRKKPLRSFAEFAEEWNIPTKKLSAIFANCMKCHNPKPPFPRIQGQGANSRYYDPDEMRAWWKSYCELKAKLGESS